MKRILTLGALAGIIILASCSKKNDGSGNTPEVTGPSKNGSALDLIRDSVYLYAREAYYWNDAIPKYADFKPRSFTGNNDLDALTKEVNAISQFKINPATGKAYEYDADAPGSAKYSFIDGGQTSMQLGGAQSSFGFAPLYEEEDDLRIRYVYAGSPAGLAGVKRGQRILAINDRTSLKYDASSGGNNLQFVINAYAYSNNIKMLLQRPDLTTFTVNLSSGGFTTNPVITYKVIDAGNGHKVGYFVFNSFTSPENATSKLNETFNYFAANGVTDLVVDFRYNGGGYVSTAEYLCDLIAPASKSNTLMYNTYFNDLLTNDKANYAQLPSLIRYNYSVADNAVKFSKKGSLNNMANIFFIVGGGTASASEIVINNLRPMGNVKLIGTTTYGKPVGFFDIKINKYELYICNFETKNSLGQGGYYTGMRPGTAEYPGKEDYDDVTHDFGDPEERLLKYALNYVKRGTYNESTLQVQSLSAQRKNFSLEQSIKAGQTLDAGKFSGMVLDKPMPKK
jgi:carboxyl-terminal processing protease